MNSCIKKQKQMYELIKNKKRDFKGTRWWTQGVMKCSKIPGLPFKITPVSQIYLNIGKKFPLMKKQMIMFKCYASLALNIVTKLPQPFNKFDLKSVLVSYQQFLNAKKPHVLLSRQLRRTF